MSDSKQQALQLRPGIRHTQFAGPNLVIQCDARILIQIEYRIFVAIYICNQLPVSREVKIYNISGSKIGKQSKDCFCNVFLGRLFVCQDCEMAVRKSVFR